MVYKCQRDSYLKEFCSQVISCSPASIETNLNGEKSTLDGFEVILEDTILFPEGGGQPCDRGRLDDVEVVQVCRRGADAVLFTRTPVKVGSTVKQTLDWDRRFDHMQHHSGQHLISGIILEKYGYETTAWWLGDDICYIELDTNKMDQGEVDYVEKMTNDKIREGVKFTVDVYDKDDPILQQVRGRGLPEDHVGGVRVVTIDGVDRDMCCGTHVSSAAHLQVVKILGVEKGKKGKINLQFIFGGRVVKKLAALMLREQQLTSLLNNGPECHVDLVSKCQKSVKVLNKNLQSVLKELAVQEAKALKSLPDNILFFSQKRS